MSGITGMIAGANSANGASEASDQQQNWSHQGLSQLNNTYNTNSQNYQPYIGAGQQALGQLQTGMAPGGSLSRNFTQADFYQDPSYKFDVNQGLSAISNANSVRGGALSGGSQKGMVNFAEQQANNGYQSALGNFVNNQKQNYQQLAGLSGQGLQATQGLGSLGNSYSQAAMGQYNNIGAEQAAGTLGRVQGENQAFNSMGSMMGGSSNNGMGMLGSLFSS